MNMFGLTAGQLDREGATWTAREILQQPEVWQEIGQQTLTEAPKIRSLTAARLGPGDTRVILTGAGTSAYIGDCLVPALRGVLQCRVDSVATTDLVSDPMTLVSDPPAVLVSFARSGNSPESVAALQVVESSAPDCVHLIYTCDAEGALYTHGRSAHNAHAMLLPTRCNDRSFAMTSSFTGMLLAAAATLGALPAAAARAVAMSELARQVIPGQLPLLQRLVAQQFARVVYLGAKEFRGLAREAALKMLELTDGKVVALAETPLGFRHGPKTIVNDATLVVLFISGDVYTRQYDLDLLTELRRDNVARHVIAISAGSTGAAEHDYDVVLQPSPGAQPCSDLELCLPYAMFAQSLALLRSLSLGIAPDNPNPGGVVHRVVRGVTIHPWHPRA